jgi:hypothetical protein
MDALRGHPERLFSPKFQSVFRHFKAEDLSREVSRELAICLSTPGFSLGDWARLLRWSEQTRTVSSAIVKDFWKDDLNVRERGRANFEQLTNQDGSDWLRALLFSRPRYAQPVPLVVTNMLRELRGAGASAAALAKMFGTSTANIYSWWAADRFEPLSGAERV